MKAIDKVERRLMTIERATTKVERYESAHTRAGRLDYDGADIHMRLGSFGEFQRMRSCAAEPWTIRWIEEHIQADDVLFDVGANVGAYSLVAAVARGAKVVAFEPVAANYEALTANVILNDVADTLLPLPTALDAETGLETLHLRILDAGGALHSLRAASEESIHPQPVLAFRLDDLLEDFGLPHPTHLKLDVDGNESRVLQGAERTLSEPGLRTVMCELHREDEPALISGFEAHGLELVERFEREPRRPGPDQPPAYGLFIRS